MATLPGGITFEMKVMFVTNDETTINTTIEAELEQFWIAGQFIINGGQMMIVFTRTITAT